MKKKFQNEEIEYVDVHNDSVMVNLGIRSKNYVTPDFTKTSKEKAALKKVRTKNTKYYSVSTHKATPIPVYDKLIVQYKPRQKGDSHTTDSMKCYGYQIPQILRDFYPDYIKYTFNGKTVCK